MPPLRAILDELEAMYGPMEPGVDDPFEMVLLENASYLVDDAKRREVLEALRDRFGLKPAALLRHRAEEIAVVIERGGMMPEMRAAKVLDSARIAQETGDLRLAIQRDPKAAKKILRRFPNVGDPYADRILLFNGAQKSIAPDSNALRVLERLGFVEEQKNYSKMYREALRATDAQIEDPAAGRRAHLLLRRHGQELCKRSAPRCEVCPLRDRCKWYAKNA